MQSWLGRRFLIAKMVTARWPRTNGLVHFRFHNERNVLDMVNQRLEILGIAGLLKSSSDVASPANMARVQ